MIPSFRTRGAVLFMMPLKGIVKVETKEEIVKVETKEEIVKIEDTNQELTEAACVKIEVLEVANDSEIEPSIAAMMARTGEESQKRDTAVEQESQVCSQETCILKQELLGIKEGMEELKSMQQNIAQVQQQFQQQQVFLNNTISNMSQQQTSQPVPPAFQPIQPQQLQENSRIQSSVSSLQFLFINKFSKRWEVTGWGLLAPALFPM